MEINATIKNCVDSMCRNCLLRLVSLNQTQQKLYLNESRNIYADMVNRNKATSTRNGCGICFGIMEAYSQEEFIHEIKEALDKEGNEFDDFRVSLSIPNFTYLRERFIELCFENDSVAKIVFNQNFMSLKEDWKKVNLACMEKILGKRFNASSRFEIKLNFTVVESLDADMQLLNTRTNIVEKSEMRRMSRKTREQKERQEKGFTVKNVDNIIGEADFDHMKQFYELPFKFVLAKVDFEFLHEQIYFAGRYCKYSRELPQTAWIIEGERKVEGSVEDLIGDILKKHSFGKGGILTASGREDVDVKCLGKGRPFTFEISIPKKIHFTKEESKMIQNEINQSTKDISVRDLQQIKWEDTKHVKEGEDAKTKSYDALCYSYTIIDENDIEKLNQFKTIKIFQNTPIRVLHRRTVMNRERMINDIQAEYVNAHHFRLKMTTQAGAYIKEFVHGDFGRTEPNICTILGKDCDILELDVLAVNLDFPPEIQNEVNVENIS